MLAVPPIQESGTAAFGAYDRKLHRKEG